MEVWQIVLYGLAALLALRSLSGLMAAYRQKLYGEIAEREEAQRQEQARLEAEAAAAAAAAKKKKARLSGAA